MIPKAGLLTFSVDKAPCSIIMMVSIVSALQANGQERPKDSYFLIRVFFMRGADYYITRKHQEVLRQNLAPLVVGYIFTYICRI